MTRLMATIWLLAAGIAALGLFSVKHRVQGLERALVQEHQAIREVREGIDVLQAEWSYLNRPAEIARLASKHLGFVPLEAEQFIGFEELPPWRAPGVDSPPPNSSPQGPANPADATPLLASAETRQ